MKHSLYLALSLGLPTFLLLGCSTTASTNAASTATVRFEEDEGRVLVLINGKPFTEYRYENVPRPICYPVLGPGGVPMTRNYPMQNLPGEAQDHPHHRSLWFTHGNVNGFDFWATKDTSGKIVHDSFLALEERPDAGILTTSNRWVASSGEVVCTDVRTLRFHNTPDNVRIMDYDITLFAPNGEVTFGDTKEGTMAIRVATSMRVKKYTPKNGEPSPVPPGHILNSEGDRDTNAWGKRAAWCAYYGKVEGKDVGVAIFDHPTNPRYPTWWHVRDYGLFAANPFGQHDFERLSDKTAGNFTIPAGQSATFRYRFIFFEGNPVDAGVPQAFAAYSEDGATH